MGLRLLWITGEGSDERVVAVAEALCASVDQAGIQLRDRTRTDEELRPLAERLREITARRGASLVVNRRVALARSIGADGVHVGRSSLRHVRSVWPSIWLSAPTHSDDDVREACADGANAVLVSPIFSTPDKGEPRGLDAVRSACAVAGRTMVVALGGIGVDDARPCFDAGADAIAVIRALQYAYDPAAVARALRHA